jgi:hypothetical protein
LPPCPKIVGSFSVLGGFKRAFGDGSRLLTPKIASNPIVTEDASEARYRTSLAEFKNASVSSDRRGQRDSRFRELTRFLPADVAAAVAVRCCRGDNKPTSTPVPRIAANSRMAETRATRTHLTRSGEPDARISDLPHSKVHAAEG